MLTTVRLITIVAWVAGMVALTTWSNSDGATVVAVIATFVAALLVGSWWFLLVPLVPAAALIVGSLSQASEADSDGVTGFMWAGYIAVITVLVVGLLAVGTLVHRLVRGATAGRSGTRRSRG